MNLRKLNERLLPKQFYQKSVNIQSNNIRIFFSYLLGILIFRVCLVKFSDIEYRCIEDRKSFKMMCTQYLPLFKILKGKFIIAFGLKWSRKYLGKVSPWYKMLRLQQFFYHKSLSAWKGIWFVFEGPQLTMKRSPKYFKRRFEISIFIWLISSKKYWYFKSIWNNLLISSFIQFEILRIFYCINF